MYALSKKQVQFCCFAGCSRRETCFSVFFAYSMLPRQQLRVSPLPGAGNGKRDAAGWKVGRWWWRWRWRRRSGCLSCPVDEWTGRDFREPWEFSPSSWMMLQGPDVIFIGLLGRRMLGIVLTCADPCCAVLCRAVASWAGGNYEGVLERLQHESALAGPCQHIASRSPRQGEGRWEVLEAVQYQNVSNIYWSWWVFHGVSNDQWVSCADAGDCKWWDRPLCRNSFLWEYCEQTHLSCDGRLYPEDPLQGCMC